MAGNEPVTSPDQRKKSDLRFWRFGGVVTIAILLAMLFPRPPGGEWRVDDTWLVGIAGLIALTLAIDWALRRNGLRS